MKILYDHQIFTNQQFGGISRYFYELIKRFNNEDNICDVATKLSNNEYYNNTVNQSLKYFLPKANFKGKLRFMKLINDRISRSELKKNNFDIFHPTYYDPYFLNLIGKKPFVVTFYDMIHEKFSSKFKELKSDTKIYKNKKKLLEHASKVIAISETTKQDIVEIFGIDKDKIDVIYLGNSLNKNYFSIPKIIEDIDYEYILFVGNRSLYKNFIFLVKTITNLLLDYNIKLICAGGGAFTNDEVETFKNLNIQDQIIYRKINSDDDLVKYYSNALFFCFPSLYEGFGIPILEAFACECPILLSNGGSLPEIAGDSALYFDPSDSHSLIQTAKKIIDDKLLRQKLIEKGRTRLLEFSWDKTYREHINLYKTLK